MAQFSWLLYRLIRLHVQDLNCIRDLTVNPGRTPLVVGYNLTRGNPKLPQAGQPLGHGRYTFHLETTKAPWRQLPGELHQ
jgi:hypothetical protein